MSRSLRLLNFFGLDFSFVKPFYRDSFCSELGTVHCPDAFRDSNP